MRKQKLLRKGKLTNFRMIILLFILPISIINALDYEVVDTGQVKYFDNQIEIFAPGQTDPFFGQDAQFNGNQPNYTNNGDDTITDTVTGLMWSKTCDTDGDGDIDVDDKLSYEEAMNSISNVNIGGYNDWRIPTIKEQYSLILFSGIDPSGFEGSAEDLVSFIDTDYFEFAYGDTLAGERLIDAQMITSTLYVGDPEMMFGVNFADGRIKGYGTGPMPGQTEDKKFYVYYVRGNENYGINDFDDNGNETISDNSSALMWSQNDSEETLNWEEALAWVQQKNTENYLGYSDWRLPNVKELQSILDYTRAPDTLNSAAIDPLFNCTEITNVGGETDYPYYWSGTTHENWTSDNGGFASYVSFGRALGWMEEPPMSGNYTLIDVHGAGAQRSDPKDGDPANFPYGNGPQGDVVRIFNYVRLVRDFDPVVGVNDDEMGNLTPVQIKLSNYPNPFNPTTTINFEISGDAKENIEIIIYNIKGEKVKRFSELTNQGSIVLNGNDEKNKPVSSGMYLYSISANGNSYFSKMLLLK
ncbi:MAG: DUF1566 domain-containing protein [Candidatus Tenebribacter burtonii]|jgi:hypothetical protein|nr:DUF1566 domain-containing protein [Candidatus Tenebribacter burtonii]